MPELDDPTILPRLVWKAALAAVALLLLLRVALKKFKKKAEVETSHEQTESEQG